LQTAVQALAASAKKLSDAYPYSSALPTSTATPSFSSSNLFTGSTIGFGRFAQQQHHFSGGDPSSGGMRDSYIQSRLRPHINDFVSACMSYLPYFSSESHHKDRFPPSETFVFLSALTKHILDQQPLTQAMLVPLILMRLSKEWLAWVQRVDVVVNSEGGMFGSETVQEWIQRLDEFAGTKSPECSQVMQNIRSAWVAKVGWLVGRSGPQAMDELY
jgi:hypothetical protein